MPTTPQLTKLDLRGEWKALYTARRKPAVIEVPARKMLCVPGRGAPEGIAEAFGPLYAVAYTLKYLVRGERAVDYPVLAPEGMFSGPGGTPLDVAIPPEQLEWAALVAVPDLIDARLLRRAIAAAMEKHPELALERVQLTRERAGLAAQVMHVGPWDAEEPTVATLMAFIDAEGYRVAGAHREIYRSDPRRTPIERARTIIRYPVKRAGGRAR